jgi:hypothetical protein
MARGSCKAQDLHPAEVIPAGVSIIAQSPTNFISFGEYGDSQEWEDPRFHGLPGCKSSDQRQIPVCHGHVRYIMAIVHMGLKLVFSVLSNPDVHS